MNRKDVEVTFVLGKMTKNKETNKSADNDSAAENIKLCTRIEGRWGMCEGVWEQGLFSMG